MFRNGQLRWSWKGVTLYFFRECKRGALYFISLLFLFFFLILSLYFFYFLYSLALFLSANLAFSSARGLHCFSWLTFSWFLSAIPVLFKAIGFHWLYSAPSSSLLAPLLGLLSVFHSLFFPHMVTLLNMEDKVEPPI